VGAAGNLPAALLTRLRGEMAALPAGTVTAAPVVPVARHHGLRVEIIRKDTRSTAISLGHPIDVTRAHPDFPALWLARAWLGEHRSSVSHLYQRIREIRGMNYGDYAYIEAFPGGMFQFFPDPNRARHHQLFEIWLRPVLPEHAHMALRIALHELRALIANGLDAGAFQSTREYLMKSTPLLTASQSDRLGYELDARWHGTPGFTEWMRGSLAALTPDEVHAAIRRHLSGTDLDVVIVTRNAEALRDALVSDAISTVTYDSPMPAALLDEDRAIGAQPLAIAPDRVRITDVDAVFAS
jgi:zinc protease